MNNKINLSESPMTFTTGCAVSRNIYYVACSPDLWRENEDGSYTSLYAFNNEHDKNTWSRQDLPDRRAVSLLFSKTLKDQSPILRVLSAEGFIDSFSASGAKQEKIPDAGLESADSVYGYVSRLVNIEGELYVCGDGGQVYRNRKNKWEHFDKNLLNDSSAPLDLSNLDPDFMLKQMTEMMDSWTQLSNINGLSQSEIYVTADNGFIAYYDGVEWDKLKPITKSHLNQIYIDHKSQVWIVGSNGTLLKGKEKKFSVLKRKSLSTDFYTITRFDGNMYIGAEDGIYMFQNNETKRLDVSDKFNLRGVSDVEEKDGVLWVLADKNLVRFDGNKWEQFEHPNNARS